MTAAHGGGPAMCRGAAQSLLGQGPRGWFLAMSSGYHAAAQNGTGRPVGAPTKRLLRSRGRRSGGGGKVAFVAV